MADEQILTTVRPVFVQYQRDVDGFLSGATFEVPTPEQAWATHPNATIIRYADGGDYSDAKARREVRERDKTDTPENVSVKRSKGSVRREKRNKDSGDVDAVTVVPAAPDVADSMITGDEVNADGDPVAVEQAKAVIQNVGK